jgi:hypothetical protein
MGIEGLRRTHRAPRLDAAVLGAKWKCSKSRAVTEI